MTTDQAETATFTYETQQVGGRWVVTGIALPNGTSVTYQYGTDKLSGVTFPDGTDSSFTYSTLNSGATTKVVIDDAAAAPQSRNLSIYLTSNFTDVAGEDDLHQNSISTMLAGSASSNSSTRVTGLVSTA